MKFKHLLLATAFFGLTQIGYTTSFEEIEKNTIRPYQQLKPNAFKNLNQDDFKSIDKMRQQFPQKLVATNDQKLIIQELATQIMIRIQNLIPAVDYPEHQHIIQRFQRELDLKAQDNSWNWQSLAILTPRFAAALSKPSQDERDLFHHILMSGAYSDLFQDNAWKDETVFAILFEQHSNKSNFYDRIKQSVYSEVSNKFPTPIRYNSFAPIKTYDYPSIDNQLNKHLPMSTPYPMYNRKFIGVLELITLYLHDVYPIAIAKPNSKLPAHGVAKGNGLSVYGHMEHDLFHQELSRIIKHGMIHNHCVEALNDAYNMGYDAKPYLKKYAPLAVLRYQNVMKLFQNIISKMIHKAIPSQEINKLHSSLAGLFYCLHEYPGWHSNMLATDSAEEVIKKLTLHAKQEIIKPTSWESADEIFPTSAVDGKPLLNTDNADLLDQTVLDLLFTHLPASANGQKLDANDIRKSTLKRTSKFIEATYKFNDGSVYQHFMPTLYHKISNMQDSIKTLKFANNNPQLIDNYQALLDNYTDENSKARVAKAYLLIVQMALVQKIEAFEKDACEIIQESDESNISLQQKFKSVVRDINIKSVNILDELKLPVVNN